MATLAVPARNRSAVPRPARDDAPSLWDLAPPVPVPVPVPMTVASTLDDVVSRAWEELAGPATAVCPVCAGHMAPRWSAGAGVVGGRCADCGTTLE